MVHYAGTDYLHGRIKVSEYVIIYFKSSKPELCGGFAPENGNNMKCPSYRSNFKTFN